MMGLSVGVLNSIQNIGQAISPLIVGLILDNNKTHLNIGFKYINIEMGIISSLYFLILLVWSVKIYYRQSRIERLLASSKKKSHCDPIPFKSKSAKKI